MTSIQSQTYLDREKRARKIGRGILSGTKPSKVAKANSATMEEVNAIAARWPRPKRRGRAS